METKRPQCTGNCLKVTSETNLRGRRISGRVRVSGGEPLLWMLVNPLLTRSVTFHPSNMLAMRVSGEGGLDKDRACATCLLADCEPHQLGFSRFSCWGFEPEDSHSSRKLEEHLNIHLPSFHPLPHLIILHSHILMATSPYERPQGNSFAG